ncbi:lipase secretion chaperone [Pseudoteredinibacter isoporae]|uniref:Lipase chaperone n=1 Tax=Pseudoteredinibacter isoporae TaxID=570281 RepID=A0A7X0JR93_9GAMM|nr:lipase secretion chaperone [Pseudoteredinibacter isoporae]MBB6520820.1 lipase chaperone LimK [Pseudoteredinibacter isoporae]NHO86386.1 hypothetical protein [Pseudoteredinibacter isoporae]NIB25162.1 hypothetical protein [Pseudoteredinibacter isoporae]
MRKWQWLLLSFVVMAATYFFYQQNSSTSTEHQFASQNHHEMSDSAKHADDKLYDIKKPSIRSGREFPAQGLRELALYLAENPLPQSMQGADVDGQLRFDDQASLIHEYANRSLFDQLLSLQGEWSLEAIERWLYDYALIAANHTSNPEFGAEQVLQAFGNYVSYLKAADELYNESAGPMPTFSASSFDDLYQLRRDILGEDIAMLYFAREENYTRSQLALANIRQDKSLSDEERLKKLKEWSANQLGYVGQEMRKTLKRDGLRKEVEQMRNEGASAEAIFAVRARDLGVEAATRLESMDVARESWQSTVDSFRGEVVRIRQLDSSDEVKNQMIDSLLANYEQSEQRRLRALVL